jgi:hypothetical protein
MLWLGLTGPAEAQSIRFKRQIGTPGDDRAYDVAEYNGSVYVVGHVRGALPGQKHAGQEDAFVRKYSRSGVLQWTRQFGSDQGDWITGVAVNSGGVYVAGKAWGPFPGSSSPGVFVRKYDPYGNVVWTQQLGSSFDPGKVALDGSAVYLTGTDYDPDPNGLLIKLGEGGTIQWTRTFGSPIPDYAWDVDADARGIYVCGYTLGALPGATSSGGLDAFVIKYNKSGDRIWVRQDGSSEEDWVNSIAVDAGGLYVAGVTTGVLPGQTGFGGVDAYVRKYDANGTIRWTHQFGGADYDVAYGIAVDRSDVFVAGELEMDGDPNAANGNAFVSKYDSSGRKIWTTTFGSLAPDHAFSVTAAGVAVYAVGATLGRLDGKAILKKYDAFLVKLTAGGP